MVIRTVNREFRVIRTLECSREMKACLCAPEGEENGDTFLFMRAEGQDLNKKMLPYFLELKENGGLGGLFDCFVSGGAVWAAFEHHEGMPLAERLKEDCPFALRLALGKELAEQIFTRRLPVYLQYEALHPSNLTVGKEEGLWAGFLLFEPERLSDSLFCEVQKRFADCFTKLFTEEGKDGGAEELSDFLGRLYRAEFSNGTDVYRAYRRVNDALLKKYGEENKKKGILTRLWRKAAGCARYAFLLFYWLLVAALWGVFVFACVTKKQAPQERTLFRSIGALVIEGYAPSYLPAEEAPQETGLPEEAEPEEAPEEEPGFPAETDQPEPEMG